MFTCYLQNFRDVLSTKVPIKEPSNAPTVFSVSKIKLTGNKVKGNISANAKGTRNSQDLSPFLLTLMSYFDILRDCLL